jgi:hypothetical protein
MATTDTSPNTAIITEMLRHTLATVAYRGGKVLRGAPEGFDEVRAGDGARSAGEILAHLGDLFDWAGSLVEGNQRWNVSLPLPWPDGVARFHTALKAFDQALISHPVSQADAERLFQGPIADSLTHIGQLAQLRRIAGSTIRPENYFQATVVKGHVGAEQAVPTLEF